MPRLSNRPPQMLRYGGDKCRVSINGKLHYLGKWGSGKAKAKYNKLIGQWRQSQEIDVTSLADRCLVVELTGDYNHAFSLHPLTGELHRPTSTRDTALLTVAILAACRDVCSISTPRQ